MSGSRLVYSTEGGPQPPPKKDAGGRRGAGGRAGGPPVPQAPEDGWLRIWRVKGGRGGKTATVITGIGGGPDAVEAVAVELRRFIGAGGGVRDGAVEIQGDHRERLQQRLTQLGYKVKLAGG